MMDAGMILIVSAVELNAADLDVIKTSIPTELISVVWVGNGPTTDIPVRMHLPQTDNQEACVTAIRRLLYM